MGTSDVCVVLGACQLIYFSILRGLEVGSYFMIPAMVDQCLSLGCWKWDSGTHHPGNGASPVLPYQQMIRENLCAEKKIEPGMQRIPLASVYVLSDQGNCRGSLMSSSWF